MFYLKWRCPSRVKRSNRNRVRRGSSRERFKHHCINQILTHLMDSAGEKLDEWVNGIDGGYSHLCTKRRKINTNNKDKRTEKQQQWGWLKKAAIIQVKLSYKYTLVCLYITFCTLFFFPEQLRSTQTRRKRKGMLENLDMHNTSPEERLVLRPVWVTSCASRKGFHSTM